MKDENVFAARFTVNLCSVDHGDLGKALVTLVLHMKRNARTNLCPRSRKAEPTTVKKREAAPRAY